MVTGVPPNSRIKSKIKKAESLDMEATADDGKVQCNNPVTSASFLMESVSAMEFNRLEIKGELNV